jgi:hypothetical protein
MGFHLLIMKKWNTYKTPFLLSRRVTQKWFASKPRCALRYKPFKRKNCDSDKEHYCGHFASCVDRNWIPAGHRPCNERNANQVNKQTHFALNNVAGVCELNDSLLAGQLLSNYCACLALHLWSIDRLRWISHQDFYHLLFGYVLSFRGTRSALTGNRSQNILRNFDFYIFVSWYQEIIMPNLVRISIISSRSTCEHTRIPTISVSFTRKHSSIEQLRVLNPHSGTGILTAVFENLPEERPSNTGSSHYTLDTYI